MYIEPFVLGVICGVTCTIIFIVILALTLGRKK